MAEPAVGISTLSRSNGRAQLVSSAGTLYVSRGHTVYRSRDWGTRWEVDCVLRTGVVRSALARVRLSARLTRQYVGGFVVLPDGTRVAIARDGIYRAGPGETDLARVFPITHGSRPLNLCADGAGRVLFGEYGNNAERREIYVYVSPGSAERFEVAHTFPRGDIRHVHNILYDPFSRAYWVFVGDYGHEPGIGLLDPDLSHLEWVARGCQEVRVVGAILEQDCLIYATDTEIEQNRIVRLDKATGKRSVLRQVEGSSLFACSFGTFRVISTCVEPGPITPDSATLWASFDGDRWNPLESFRKDPLFMIRSSSPLNAGSC